LFGWSSIVGSEASPDDPQHKKERKPFFFLGLIAASGCDGSSDTGRVLFSSSGIVVGAVRLLLAL
jgi:hypothetical protein